MARAALQELPRAVRDRRKHLAELLRPRQGLRELGEVLELTDALPGLLVEAGVLDRSADERRRRREELDLLRGELARRLVCIEIAPMTASRPETGTERSDWNFSSSSSETNSFRGSSIAFCVNAGSPCSTAHHAIPFASVISPTRSV